MSGPSAKSMISESASEQKINQRFTDDYTNPTTNEGNLLSLITLKQIVGGQQGVDDTLRDMAKEETRHLMLAMKILTNRNGLGNAAADSAAAKLQDKFGRDMNAAIKLGKLLKAKGDAKEVELMLQPFVQSTIVNKGPIRAGRGGFTLGGLGNQPQSLNTAPGPLTNVFN